MNDPMDPAETDCVAGVVGFELRNVGANYPFERSHRFAGIQPNSGDRDYSRLSCDVGDSQLGPRARTRGSYAGAWSAMRIPVGHRARDHHHARYALIHAR
jgi:hypothetical protein